jgi:Skp family chaperone for outer membrane proteins
MQQWINGSGFLARSLLTLAVAGSLLGAASLLAPRSPTIAVVDLRKVLSQLNERAQAEASLKTMAESLQAEMDRRQNELKDVDQKIADTQDPAARRRLQEDRAFKALDAESWAALKSNEVDAERALLLQSLYRSIREAAAAMAKDLGYDLVVMDDATAEIRVNSESQATRESQVSQQINARRLLYANPELDITDSLITRMNNVFKAGS